MSDQQSIADGVLGVKISDIELLIWAFISLCIGVGIQLYYNITYSFHYTFLVEPTIVGSLSSGFLLVGIVLLIDYSYSAYDKRRK